MVLYLGMYITWLHAELWHKTKGEAVRCLARRTEWGGKLTARQIEALLRTVTLFKIGKGAGDREPAGRDAAHAGAAGGPGGGDPAARGPGGVAGEVRRPSRADGGQAHRARRRLPDGPPRARRGGHAEAGRCDLCGEGYAVVPLQRRRGRQHLRRQEEHALQQDHHREEPRYQLQVIHRRVLRCVRLRHLEIH